MARTAALAPDSGANLATMANLAREGIQAQSIWGHHRHALALVYLRGKEYQKAITTVRTATTRDPNWMPGLNQLVLALANHGLGRSEEARRRLAEAKNKKPVSIDHHHDRWAYEVLLREAEPLIGAATKPPR